MRNCDKICNLFSNDITNFKNNNNFNLAHTSYKISNCDKSYESYSNCFSNKICDTDNDSLSLYSTSSSDESCSSNSDLPSNCNKSKYKPKSHKSKYKYNNSDSNEESYISESTMSKPKLRKSNIISRLDEIKTESQSSDSSESTKMSNKKSSIMSSKISMTLNSNNNCEESNICNTGNTHKKTNKYLKLTDIFSRNTQERISVSISNHGKYIYMVYNTNIDCSGNNNIAEIFENKCGKLITKKVLNGDNEFSLVSSGYASSNFNKFSLLEDNQISEARLRILDSKFNTLVSATFNDYCSQGNSFRGGKFIDNEKYVAVTYVYSSDNEDRQKSVLRILRTDTLEQAYEYKFIGNTYSNVKYFKLTNSCGECETYVALLTNDGIYNTVRPQAKSFSVLKILKLDSENNKIRLIDQALLPQIGDFDLIEKNNHIYIVVGTNRADVNKNKSMFNQQSKSLLLNNGDELRVYIFGDNKLELLYSKNLDTCVKVLFHPNKDNILIQQNNLKISRLSNNECTESDSFNYTKEIVSYPGFFNINSLHINKCEIGIRNSYVTRTAPNNFVAEFSKNGKWLIVAGSKENSDDSDNYGIKNVQLYNVSLQ